MSLRKELEALQYYGTAAITWQEMVMLIVSCVLIYLGLKKGFEPLLAP